MSSPIARPKVSVVPALSISSEPLLSWRSTSSMADRVVAAASGIRTATSLAAVRTASGGVSDVAVRAARVSSMASTALVASSLSVVVVVAMSWLLLLQSPQEDCHRTPGNGNGRPEEGARAVRADRVTPRHKRFPLETFFVLSPLVSPQTDRWLRHRTSWRNVRG